VTRRCAVRFVQVVGADLDAEARTEADAATFQAALTALRGHPRLRCTFEVVSGSPGRKLVERSRRATVLVVGDDRPGSGASVAAYCQRHAACCVQLVAQT
jgi:nucleotide-binding universal stress UspA family protein